MKVMICAVAALLALSACKAVKTPAEEWLGRWQGVEGTYLEIARSIDGYEVVIQDLDGPRTFRAAADAEGLSFTRDNIKETIHPGNGADTGMKWLADKQTCLVIKMGEGYCRF